MTYNELTQYAIEKLIDAINYEKKDIERLRQTLKDAQSEVGKTYGLAIALEGNVWAAYSGYLTQYYNLKEKKEQEKIAQEKLLEAQNEMAVKESSSQYLAMSILQIAKQGISTRYGGLAGCPEGRLILGKSLKEFIWYGRNQSIHFEESNLRPPTENFFEQIKVHNPVFNNYKTKNMGYEIVNTINWTTYSQYLSDMKNLME